MKKDQSTAHNICYKLRSVLTALRAVLGAKAHNAQARRLIAKNRYGPLQFQNIASFSIYKKFLIFLPL